MRFFEPPKKFFDWLVAYAGNRIVFDVGSGEGHIVRELRDRKVKVVGVEPRWLCDDLYDPMLSSCILPQMAEECSLLRTTKNSLVMFCRPCHSGFVDRTLRLLPSSSEALYISPLHNLGVDFPLEEFKHEQLQIPHVSMDEIVVSINLSESRKLVSTRSKK